VMLWNRYAAALKKVEALQAELDALITERIHERAAEILIRLRLMPWRLARAWGDSPPRNSWTTCRLNSIECVRCLAMGFLLESPVQLADSQVPHLSTPRGALQAVSDSRRGVLPN
jgi:hypothetical protein